MWLTSSFFQPKPQEELDALKEQAQALSELLFLWNEYDGGSEEALAKVMNMNS